MPPQTPTVTTLSRRHRRTYFQILLLVFVIVVPLLFLYATGYRFDGLTDFTKTGGIYIGAELSSADMYINNELVQETGTFRRAFYVQDLLPGTYEVKVLMDGYHPWFKTIMVSEHRVTEAQAFNLPEKPLLELISPTVPNDTRSGTSTMALPNPVYVKILATFATTTATSTTTSKVKARATSTTLRTAVPTTSVEIATTTKEFRGMRLSEAGKRVIATWTRDSESAPFYVCPQDTTCVPSISVNTQGEQPASFDFFPGTMDLVIVTLKDGIYVTELDNQSGQNIQSLFLATGANFRIVDGSIYIKVGATLYQVQI